MPTKMHHIGIEVSDIKKSEAFYVDLLGFTKIREIAFEDRGRYISFLELGDVCIELLCDKVTSPYVAPPSEQCGYKHLALATVDVKADIARLKAAGVTVTLEPLDTALGSRIAFVADPDGIPVELWQDL